MDALPSAILVSFLWGMAPVIHKHVLKTVDTKVMMIATGAVYAACLLLFAVYSWKDVKKGLHKLDVYSVAWIVFAAVTTAFVANLVYLYVLKKHDSYVISALIYSAPVFTLALAYLFLHERPTLTGYAGVCLIIAGVLCLAYGERGGTEEFLDDHF